MTMAHGVRRHRHGDPPRSPTTRSSEPRFCTLGNYDGQTGFVTSSRQRWILLPLPHVRALEMEIRFRSSSSPGRPLRMLTVVFTFVVFATD